jgi:hypothetical protein
MAIRRIATLQGEACWIDKIVPISLINLQG